jgi:membrane-associated phospholipid phosphatase
MTVLIVVLVCGVGAAVAAFASSFGRHMHVDLIDPTLPEAAVRRSLRHHPKVRRFIAERMDRNTAGGFMVSAAFVVTFVVASAMGLLMALIDRSDTLQEIDQSVAAWGSEHATSRSVDVIKLVTHLGSTPVMLSALVLAATADYARRHKAEVFAFAATVGLGELLLNNLIKVLVRRDRPEILQLMGAGGFSFPSGHSAAAAAGWSAVALILGRNRPRMIRAILSAAAALLAISVATSRALLGVHWVSDVIGGLAFGWGWFLLVAIIFGGRRQRFGDPVAGIAAEPQDAHRHGHGHDRDTSVNA